MIELATTFTTLGALLLAALVAEAVGRHTRLPRISLLVLLGFLVGPGVLGVVDTQKLPGLDFIAVLALSMVGFLVGGRLSSHMLNSVGRQVLWISLSELLATFFVLAVGLYLLGASMELSLVLAAIASATDPAATFDAIRGHDQRNEFTDTLTGIVAIDDAWCLMVFSLVLVAIQLIQGNGIDTAILGEGLGEILASIFLGVGLGWPMAWASGRIRKGEPTLMEALGIVMICAGVSLWLDLSYLLASVCLGLTVTNIARHHKRPFHAIEEVEWPFLALFFIFSGAAITIETLSNVGMLLLAYILLRIVGRLTGGALAALPRQVDSRQAILMGGAMLPQGGIAMALAYTASQSVPGLEGSLTALVVAAVFVFEIMGPIATRFCLERVSMNS